MKFHEKKIPLKNGKTVTIREAQLSDAERLLSLLKDYVQDSPFIPKLSEEIRLTVDEERSWIRSFLEAANSILLVAEHEGQLIGNIDLTGSRREVMRHTGMIGMGMLKEWRNAGLGTALLNAVIEWSTQNQVTEVIWLQVYTANKPAIHLYRKAGFRENGTVENFFRHGSDYFHQLTMSLAIKDLRQ